ncbi:MAG TPA: DUF2142 domain-containing protein [Actinomycetes bacterium]
MLLVLFLGAIAVTWAVLNPLGAVPDEQWHTVYAAAVVRGQLGSGPDGTQVTIPGPVFSDPTSCIRFTPEKPLWLCPGIPPGPDTTITMGTSAAGYPPLYYAIVGLPTYLPFGSTPWLLMRLLSVALGMSLIGVPLLLCRRTPMHWIVVGCLAAFTPMVAFLVASVNPNGAEIAAAIGTCISAVALVRGLTDQDSTAARRAAGALAVTSAYLMLARPYSFVQGVALLACIALVVPTAAWHQARALRRMLAAWACVPAVALVTGVAFQVLKHGTSGGASASGSRIQSAWDMSALLFDYVLETVGIFGWRDYYLPPWLMWLGVAAAVSLVTIGIAAGTRRQRFGLITLGVGATTVAPLLGAVFVWGTEWKNYQGRYALPLLVGIPLLGAAVGHFRSVRPGEVGRRLAPLVVWALLLENVWGWCMTVIRYGTGLPLFVGTTLQPREFHWFHSVPTTVVIAGTIVAALALGVLVARSIRRDPGWPVDARQPSGAPEHVAA